MNTNPDYQYISSIHELTYNNIKGESVNFSVYKGHVCIIVNVASKCGLAESTYKQLNELYDKYAEEKGLRILAFPCNQFGNKEPGSAEDIIKFATDHKVKFDIFEKVDVNGDNASPLWKFLKCKLKGDKGRFIKWNFSKFIVNQNGFPVERHESNVEPLDLIASLERLW